MRKKRGATRPKRRKQSMPLRWQARVTMHQPSFRLLARRAGRALARSPYAEEDQAWVDEMSWWNSPEAAEFEKNEPPIPWWRVPK
jgi:hypothetical protein